MENSVKQTTTNSPSTSNPFSQNIVESTQTAPQKGADITVEVVADWTFKALGAAAAGIVIYNAVKGNDTASS